MTVTTRGRLAGAASLLLAASAAFVIGASSPAGADVTVTTEAELRAAFADTSETLIELTADLTIACDGDNQMFRLGAGQADLVIDGNGHQITFPCNDGNEAIFVNDDVGATITLRDITLVDTGSGYAAAVTDGPLIVESATIVGWADALRGDTIVMTGSYVRDATGAAVRPDEGAVIRNSTVAGNVSAVAADGEVVLENSTFTGSTGAALLLRNAQATLTHVTLAGNATHLSLVESSLTSTAVAYGPSSGAPCDFGGGPVTSGGYNLAAGACDLEGATDQAGLGGGAFALSALGGDGPALRPGAGSVLVDAIPAGECALAADQVGTARPLGEGCEVGSIEVVPTAAPPAAPPAPPAAPAPAAPRFTG